MTSIKKTRIISMPDMGSNGRKKLMSENAANTDPGTSKSESGLKMNIDGKGAGKANGIAHLHSQDYDEDEDDDFGDEEMDDFDDSVIQSAAAILDRGEKKLYNKLRPHDEWSGKVVSTPNIWHKD